MSKPIGPVDEQYPTVFGSGPTPLNVSAKSILFLSIFCTEKLEQFETDFTFVIKGFLYLLLLYY
jgi:hypothetical protein